MLCKHEVSGSIPLSSTTLIRCFLIAAIHLNDADQETGWPNKRKLAWQVSYRLRAGTFRELDKVWIFDNEIDWVMRIWFLSLVPAAARQLEWISA